MYYIVFLPYLNMQYICESIKIVDKCITIVVNSK